MSQRWGAFCSLVGNLRTFSGQASTLRMMHGWATFVWGVLFIPGLLWWKNSVPFLVGVSIYANFVGHFSSWQASRTEVKQDQMSEGSDGAATT